MKRRHRKWDRRQRRVYYLTEDMEYRWCACGDRATVVVGKTAYCPDCANEVLTDNVHDNVEKIMNENAARSGGSSGRFHNDGCLDNGVRALEDAS